MANRIEKVKKILAQYTLDARKPAFEVRATEASKRICQLFPQPLDDKELKKWIEVEIVKYMMRKGAMIKLPWPLSKTILALLQPKIEEAKREEREMVIGIVVKELEHRKVIVHTHPLHGGDYCQMCLFVNAIRRALKGGERITTGDTEMA